MRSVSSWVEYLIIGGGSSLAFVLVLLIFFEVRLFPPEGSEVLLYVVESAPWLGIIPLLGLMCVGGMIQDRIAYLLFQPWERNLRKYAIAPDKGQEPSPENYYRVRSFFLTSPGTAALMELYFQNRARLRIFRAWTLNGLMTFFLLAYRELTHTVFHPYLFPAMLIFGLLALGCVGGWYAATISEHKVLNRFHASMTGMED